jgi:hypothetical protein
MRQPERTAKTGLPGQNSQGKNSMLEKGFLLGAYFKKNANFLHSFPETVS